MVDNLDTDPSLLRFCNVKNDIFYALVAAINRGDYISHKNYSSSAKRAPSKKTWDRSITDDDVPKLFIDWLISLFPDLSADWLLVTSPEIFVAKGKPIETARARWKLAIEFFSKRRDELQRILKTYYKDVDDSQARPGSPTIIPLLTKPGWIRSTPITLCEDSEQEIITAPDPAREYTHQKLYGLLGDYISYKGSLTNKKRRTSNTEPQHNGEIFCVSDVILSDNEFIGFRYHLAHYYDYVNTCEILGAELADWVISNEKDASAVPQLDYRGKPENAFDFESRACYPGINCLTVFLNYTEHRKVPKGNYFLLHKRDETQLQAQNSVHVLPAGGHQGYSKNAHCNDTAIWRTVVREFFEELFNKEKLNRQPESWEDFLADEEILRLTSIFFRGSTPAAHIYLHGFGLDPITLKPEVIVTIVVNWDIALSQAPNLKLAFNWEIKNKKNSRHEWVELSKDELIRQADGGVLSIGDKYLKTLPAGAACMIKTAEHYELLVGA
jgi:hypothetical protein